MGPLEELSRYYPDVPRSRIDGVLKQCGADTTACLEQLEALQRQHAHGRCDADLPDPVRDDARFGDYYPIPYTGGVIDLPSPLIEPSGQPVRFPSSPMRNPPDGARRRTSSSENSSDAGLDRRGASLPQLVRPPPITAPSAALELRTAGTPHSPAPLQASAPSRRRSSSLRKKAKSLTFSGFTRRLRRGGTGRQEPQPVEQSAPIEQAPQPKLQPNAPPSFADPPSQGDVRSSSPPAVPLPAPARADSPALRARSPVECHSSDVFSESSGHSFESPGGGVTGSSLLGQASSNGPSLLYLNVCKVAERLREREREMSSLPTVEVPPSAASVLCSIPGHSQREESIKGGKRMLTIRTSGLAVKQLEMGDDGNCLFRAVAQQLHGTQERHFDIRETCVEQLDQQRELYSMFFDDDAGYNGYVEQMQRPGMWGDELALKALCDRLEIVAYVLISTPGNWYLRYVPSHLDESRFAHCKTIFLTYLSPIHYNALTYLDGAPISLTPEEVRTMPALNCDTRRVCLPATS